MGQSSELELLSLNRNCNVNYERQTCQRENPGYVLRVEVSKSGVCRRLN